MSSFSLHRLPNNAVKSVLRHMEIPQILSYSLCSKSTKNIVKMLNLSSLLIRFEVGLDILVTVQIDMLNQLLIILPLDLNLASFPSDEVFSIRVDSTGTRTWSLPEFSNQKVLYHLMDIFHHHGLDALYFNEDAVPFEVMESVQRILHGVRIGSLTLVQQLAKQFVSRAVKTFQNCDELHVRDFIGLEVDKVLMQNLRRVVAINAFDMNINQVLVSNVELIQLNLTRFVEKDYNRFLKLWIRGSNPRLKKFDAGGGASPYRRLDVELILKGIKCKRIPLECDAVHRRKMIGGWEEETELAGGYVIRRYNGNDAVVLIERDSFNFITDCFSSD